MILFANDSNLKFFVCNADASKSEAQVKLDCIMSGIFRAALTSIEIGEQCTLKFGDTTKIDKFVASLIVRSQLTGAEKTAVLLASYITQAPYEIYVECGEISFCAHVVAMTALGSTEDRVYTTTDTDDTFVTTGEIGHGIKIDDAINFAVLQVCGSVEAEDFDTIRTLLKTIVPKRIPAKQKSKPLKQFNKVEKKHKANLAKASKRKN